MTRFDRYEKELDRLARLLGGRALTAREIAKRTRCSKPTVYARLRELESRGAVIERTPARAGRCGPCASRFRVVAAKEVA